MTDVLNTADVTPLAQTLPFSCLYIELTLLAALRAADPTRSSTFENQLQRGTITVLVY